MVGVCSTFLELADQVLRECGGAVIGSDLVTVKVFEHRRQL